MYTFKRLLIASVLFVVSISTVAQDAPITVCRDPRFAAVRFEFHNIPLDWFVLGSDAPNWSYTADAVAMYPDVGVIVADADTQPASLFTYDSVVSVVGDADSPLCDPSLSPVQDEGLEIVITPTPATLTACTDSAINGVTGQSYCYTPLANGVIPIPPAAS